MAERIVIHAEVGEDTERRLRAANECGRTVVIAGKRFEFIYVSRAHGQRGSTYRQRTFELLEAPRTKPVTDDELDAPDGARVGDYVRHGDQWLLEPENADG
jgi:hypothetical protein